jgi:hypothetical protein
MDKAVKRHILKKRIVLAKRSDEPMTFTERAPRFLKWFEEDVMGFDSEEYRREFWREAYRHGRTIGHMPHTLSDQLRSRGRRSEIVLFDALCISLLMGGAFAIWVMRRKIDQHLHRLRRPSYYETERMRRLGLTEERRRIRSRTTVNPRPTAEQLREAFLHARDSVENMVRLGSLMEDLECYIDNSLVFGEDGKIIARKGGIRRYIQSEIPDLYKSYKTLMRYKALARKFRQAVGISDPIPAASALPKKDDEIAFAAQGSHYREASGNTVGAPDKNENILINDKKNKNDIAVAKAKSVENMVRTDSHGTEEGSGGDRRDRGGDGEVDGGNGENHRLNDEVRRTVNEILGVCEGTFLDLAAVLALRICEDAIPHKSYKRTCISACA